MAFGGFTPPLPPCIVVINIIVRFNIDDHVWVMAVRKNDFKGEKYS